MNEIIMSYIAMWAPSIASILSVVVLIVPVIYEIKKWFKGLREDKTLIEVSKKLEILSSENKELVRCNKLLLDQLTKIQNYADYKKED